MKSNCANVPGYRTPASIRKTTSAFLERLESRWLLSAVTPLHAATVNSTVQGFTPAQIAHAYGFDQVTFSNGAVPGNGAGETIAITDAFNDPTIAADLAVFDQQFGLNAPPSLTVVNQTGGTTLPVTDGGWAGEISLDVEWAHAMAPQANILLVEANSDSNDDLLATVSYARHVTNVSVISMSWGAGEFASFGQSQSQLSYDPIFTTPSGHIPITFVVSSGDSGSANGAQWPSTSPNVLSVGGTALTTSDNAGTYASETPWAGSQEGASGGLSTFEIEPAYQQGAQQSGDRSTPDVGYNADPATGVAVYDSTPDQNGDSGWGAVGGTSAGAPQWASLIAIVNQGRAIAGKATLEGASQALPALYSVYSAPGTPGYATYTSYFHDTNSDGYDYTTGLGSPQVQAVVPLLVNASTPTPTPTPTPTSSPSPISGVFIQNPPPAVVEGSNGALKVRVTNTGSTLYQGAVTVTLFASTDATQSSDDAQVSSITLSNVSLKGHASKIVAFKFAYPNGVTAGSYDLITHVVAPGIANTTPTDGVSSSKVTIEPATVDLATTFSGSPITVKPSQKGIASIIITNNGNVTASGTLGLTLAASADQTLEVSDQVLTSFTGHKINIRAGRSVTLRLHFVAPAGSPGSYSLIASTTSVTNPLDTNALNDIAVVATA